MGIMVRERAAQESALMEQRRGDFLCGALQPEPQLPCGWEKCLDLKSGLVYFKDWNSGTLTYRDPRQTVPVTTQRIGLLSISFSPESPSNASRDTSDGTSKKFRRMKHSEAVPSQQQQQPRLPWTLSTDGDSSATETTTTTSDCDDHSLELSLHLPGTSSARPPVASAAPIPEPDSVQCTMEKVRSALERSNWLNPRKRSTSFASLPDTLSTVLSLLSPGPSCSRESNFSPRLQAQSSGAMPSASSPSTSQCSDSECFTSPSVMSYEGDDDEVQQQPRVRRLACAQSLQTPVADAAAVSTSGSSTLEQEVMVTVGCKSCLMYVMLSKAHPSCPKCGNTDVLLELPAAAAPLPKKPRLAVEHHVVTTSSRSTWSWCTA